MFEDAISLYERALRVDPTNSEVKTKIERAQRAKTTKTGMATTALTKLESPAQAQVPNLPGSPPVKSDEPTTTPRRVLGVSEAVLLERIAPEYPRKARAQHLEGKVTLSARIGVDGSVLQVAVVSGSPVLAEAAKTAVLKWHYRPAVLNGSPIEVQKEIIIVFAQP